MRDRIQIKHPLINEGDWTSIHVNSMTESGDKNIDAKPYVANDDVAEANDLSFENPKLGLPSVFLNIRDGFLTRDMVITLYKNRYDADNPILMRASHQGIELTDLSGNKEVQVALENYSITWASQYRKVTDDLNSGLEASLTFVMTKKEV
jgi:hypothetical protein